MLSQTCNYYYLMLVLCMLNLALNRVKVFQQEKTESQLFMAQSFWKGNHWGCCCS